MSPPNVRARQWDSGATSAWDASAAVSLAQSPDSGSFQSIVSYNYWWPYPPEGAATMAGTSATQATTSAELQPTMTTATPTTAAAVFTTASYSSSKTLDTSTYTVTGGTNAVAVASVSVSATEATTKSPVTAATSGFKIIYLIPLFVMVVVFLGAVVAVWLWNKWARRRGRANSLTGSMHTDSDVPYVRKGYDKLEDSKTHQVVGVRRVSARRTVDSDEDFRLPPNSEGKESLPPMPMPMPIRPLSPRRVPRYGSDSDDAYPFDEKMSGHTRMVQGWAVNVRSAPPFVGSSVSQSPPNAPTRDRESLISRGSSIAPSDSPSGDRRIGAYRAAAKARNQETGTQRLQTPLSYIDETSFYSQETARHSNCLPANLASRLRCFDQAPSKHNRQHSLASSDDDGFRSVRRSQLEKTELLKDEDPTDEYTMESSEDEQSAASPTEPSRPRHEPPAALQTTVEGELIAPITGNALASMRLSAAFAQDRRHSSAVAARSRRSAQPSSTVSSSSSANDLLMRLKDRLEQRNAARGRQFTSPKSPTPSEAQIGSAFRDSGSPQAPPLPPKDSQLAILPSRGARGKTLAFNASELSLELQAPPPSSSFLTEASRRSANSSSSQVSHRLRSGAAR
ncbi:hypothetical protein BKA62DRAFT_253775 [Auriculariales sp. MPI-PUGE-AT-0066]|nr:hypothetical protein BKA62DRAFT_253775 [Auriculariales sp. MPI-PUGE-AT-0066]